jgi:hypothetical protein
VCHTQNNLPGTTQSPSFGKADNLPTFLGFEEKKWKIDETEFRDKKHFFTVYDDH